jgi:hypothetical protein
LRQAAGFKLLKCVRHCFRCDGVVIVLNQHLKAVVRGTCALHAASSRASWRSIACYCKTLSCVLLLLLLLQQLLQVLLCCSKISRCAACSCVPRLP